MQKLVSLFISTLANPFIGSRRPSRQGAGVCLRHEADVAQEVSRAAQVKNGHVSYC
jgi:hypothetical protein